VPPKSPVCTAPSESSSVEKLFEISLLTMASQLRRARAQAASTLPDRIRRLLSCPECRTRTPTALNRNTSVFDHLLHASCTHTSKPGFQTAGVAYTVERRRLRLGHNAGIVRLPQLAHRYVDCARKGREPV
jgi:hypothetical protein